MSDLILYTSDDGSTRIDLRVDGGTIWLSQGEIAELFQTTKQNVSLHSQNIFADGELTPAATVKESLTVQTEGKRTVKRTVSLYNLDLILAIGYRVRSPRGVQFRQWATTSRIARSSRSPSGVTTSTPCCDSTTGPCWWAPARSATTTQRGSRR